jgi:hypothetical protein
MEQCGKFIATRIGVRKNRKTTPLVMCDTRGNPFLDGRKPDVTILNFHDPLTPIHTCMIGKIKFGSITKNDLGEILTFANRLFKMNRLRQEVIAFITNCQDIQFWKLTRKVSVSI